MDLVYFDFCLSMFFFIGGQCASGLRLLENESGFSMFYQDRSEKWRTVGDVPWK